MFVEGHWKVLKHDFLYKFFRPRLDFLAYVILKRLIPLQQRKFQQILLGHELLEWQKSIKAEWKKLSLRKTDNFNTYGTNLENWVCGCPYFLTNKFMICKHLVNLKDSIDIQTFESIKHNGVHSFLIFDNSLIVESRDHAILLAHNGENNNEENTNKNDYI